MKYHHKVLGTFFLTLLMAMTSHAALAEDGEVTGEYASLVNSSSPIIPGQFALIAQKADEFISDRAPFNHTIFAATLVDGVDDPNVADEIGNFFVVDLRAPQEYAMGHIPGAVNIPLAIMAKPESLAVLPINKPILLVCHTGQGASVVNGILGTLGYNAWTLRFGMMSWRAYTPMPISSPTSPQGIAGGGYAMVTGSQP